MLLSKVDQTIEDYLHETPHDLVRPSGMENNVIGVRMS